MTETEAIENVNAAGSKRHGGQWFLCNQRAVEHIWTTQSTTQIEPKIKLLCMRVILACLDRAQIDLGLVWNNTTSQWDKKDPK